MHCSECGAQLTNNSKFCSTCGHAITGNVAQERQVAVNPPPETPVHAGVDASSLGKKWLEFWQYIILPVGSMLGLMVSLNGPALAIIMMVPMSILQFVVASGLISRRLWGWQWNWVLIVIAYIRIAIPTPMPAHSGGADLVVQFVIQTVLGGLIWMWPNYVYWKKRKALFS